MFIVKRITPPYPPLQRGGGKRNAEIKKLPIKKGSF